MKKKKNRKQILWSDGDGDGQRDDTIIMIPRNLQEGIESMKHR